MEVKLFKARLQTGGKTPDQIAKSFEGFTISRVEILGWIRAFNSIDGMKIVVMQSLFSDGYIPVSWDKEDDEKIRDFIYWTEQDKLFGSYVDGREDFISDWNTGDYSPAGSLTFDAKDIQILEEMEKE